MSTPTIDAPDSTRSVGTAPWGTTKFVDVEKKLLSPHEFDKSSNDICKKTSEAYIPILEGRRSFGKSKKDDDIESTR